MNKITTYFIVFFFGILIIPQATFSQEETLQEDVNQDDLGNVTDEFQEYFFEALAQRAIENYEKAIDALQKCNNLQPDETSVSFELGKNYKALKKYEDAENAFLKTLQQKPENQDVLTELYDVYYLTENYPEAIKTAKKLRVFNIDYYEDLANLYSRTHEYIKALEALDYIDNKQGKSEYRDDLREKIYGEISNPKELFPYLEKRIQDNPKSTKNYLDLIYFYTEFDEVKKAYQTAKNLQKIKPDAPEAHLALYKLYLKDDKKEQAVSSIKKVLNSKGIDEETKLKVLQDFMGFVKENPEYNQELMTVLNSESGIENKSNKQRGEYYLGKDNAKALQHFKKALKENPNDYDLTKKTLLLLVEEKNYNETLDLAEKSLAYFPSQAIIYLLQGVSYNATNQYKKAASTLKTGLDFLIENPKMEYDFYEQLQKSYKALGEEKKAQEYKQKKENIKLSK